MKPTSLRAKEFRANPAWETCKATKSKIRARATFPDRSGVKTSLAIIRIQDVQVASKLERRWLKNTQNGTYVRPVIVYRDKTKAFSESAARSGAGQAGFMVDRREVLKLALRGMAGGIAARGGVAAPV